MHRSHAPSRPSVARWPCQFWADCTINIYECEFPTGTGLFPKPKVPLVRRRTCGLPQRRLRSSAFAQRDAIAHAMQPTIHVVAAFIVVDAIAVADVEPVLRAVPPDRMLHKPRECPREPQVELAGVNFIGDHLNNVCTPIRLITGSTVSMIGFEPTQNTRANKKIVHQRVDCNH